MSKFGSIPHGWFHSVDGSAASTVLANTRLAWSTKQREMHLNSHKNERENVIGIKCRSLGAVNGWTSSPTSCSTGFQLAAAAGERFHVLKLLLSWMSFTSYDSRERLFCFYPSNISTTLIVLGFFFLNLAKFVDKNLGASVCLSFSEMLGSTGQ